MPQNDLFRLDSSPNNFKSTLIKLFPKILFSSFYRKPIALKFVEHPTVSEFNEFIWVTRFSETNPMARSTLSSEIYKFSGLQLVLYQ